MHSLPFTKDSGARAQVSVTLINVQSSARAYLLNGTFYSSLPVLQRTGISRPVARVVTGLGVRGLAEGYDEFQASPGSKGHPVGRAGKE